MIMELVLTIGDASSLEALVRGYVVVAPRVHHVLGVRRGIGVEVCRHPAGRHRGEVVGGVPGGRRHGVGEGGAGEARVGGVGGGRLARSSVGRIRLCRGVKRWEYGVE